MSLARAFTTRRKQSSQDLGILPQRSNTTARKDSISVRNKISGPMALTHTTNMLAYNAPDLYPQPESSPTESSKSDDSSTDTPRTSASSPPTSPDLPSATRPGSPEPNHLSCYFVAPGNKQAPPVVNEAPVIPKRSPSHTKKASMDNLANKFSRLSNQSNKSVSTKASFSLSRSSSTSTTATSVSSGSFSRKPSISSPSVPAMPSMVTSPPPARPNFRRDYSDTQHPFGQELAQVSELAEELGVKEKMQVIDEEEQELIAKGLRSFRPEDYLAEVQGLFATFFKPEPAAMAPVWI
ncbi:uncharacterized protein F4807DRAFT_109980 [Annulohypoxylon truncatum]|uniref:uncharacterized protein n=1 Tax=Annulohypoxylon truncatum TaxID=327061 RepID=UPI002007BE5B|nr:uncharacterized protein F4807DRAFT_109980 [Annulohypoxylon truncatum]KAI1209095.1 hypothetical protein F4807DRAFT_109980 [Annulohypoxylon truncatum]